MPVNTSGGGRSVEARVHDSLEMLADLHAYNRWYYRCIRPFLRGSICDVGCGTGNFIQFLLNHELVVGIDPYDASLAVARERFHQCTNIRFVRGWLSDFPGDAIPPGSFDTVICLRLLESMGDDVDSLRRMRQLCRDNGNVVIVASALMSAYGELDRAVGHHRRYNRCSLARAFGNAGLSVIYSAYQNTLGYFGWLWHSRVLRKREIPTFSAQTLNRLVPFLDVLERIVHPPFGQSIVMVGTPLPSSPHNADASTDAGRVGAAR
ncbi:MAG: class I SAM-dependent methyltransferase [Phycisphaerae bacterium]